MKLAQHSAATWQRIRGEAFLGEVIVETANTLYRFEDGVLHGRAPKRSTGDRSTPWELPPAMAGLELIGFLADEGGLWSLSPRWRPGSLAVMWTAGRSDASGNAATNDAFTLTSPAEAFTMNRAFVASPCTRSADHRAHVARQVPERSDVFAIARRGPPTVRRPGPPSMTRLQPAPPAR